jgi:DNA-binding response OmpR family regulator
MTLSISLINDLVGSLVEHKQDRLLVVLGNSAVVEMVADTVADNNFVQVMFVVAQAVAAAQDTSAELFVLDAELPVILMVAAAQAVAVVLAVES